MSADEPSGLSSRSFEDFWKFSLDRYGRPGVAELCLDLQDRLGVDVNVLLLALWCGQASLRLDPETLERILESGPRQWHEAVVRPLRAARRAAKSPPAGLPKDMAEPVRERLKAVEIECEKLEQRLLFTALQQVNPAPAWQAGGQAGGEDASRRRAVAAENVNSYLNSLSSSDSAASINATAERFAGLCVE